MADPTPDEMERWFQAQDSEVELVFAEMKANAPDDEPGGEKPADVGPETEIPNPPDWIRGQADVCGLYWALQAAAINDLGKVYSGPGVGVIACAALAFTNLQDFIAFGDPSAKIAEQSATVANDLRDIGLSSKTIERLFAEFGITLQV
jgi:hypothetical protein